MTCRVATWATSALLALTLLCATTATAQADAYVRVISQRAPIHTGPGPSYRDIYTAERGEVFPVLERGTRGYWFRIRMEDGTTGWIFGELVFPFQVVDKSDPGFFGSMWRGIRRAILGPSPIVTSDVEISFSAGILDLEGLYLLRPAWLIDKYFALEFFAGLSPRAQKDLYLVGVGWTLRMVPGAAVGPYVHAGIGVSHQRPKADNFTEKQETLVALVAGGGFEITFKKQITLRLDFRNWTLHDANQSSNGQEFTGGLAIFF